MAANAVIAFNYTVFRSFLYIFHSFLAFSMYSLSFLACQTIISWASGSEDWKTTPRVFDVKQIILSLFLSSYLQRYSPLRRESNNYDDDVIICFFCSSSSSNCRTSRFLKHVFEIPDCLKHVFEISDCLKHVFEISDCLTHVFENSDCLKHVSKFQTV